MSNQPVDPDAPLAVELAGQMPLEELDNWRVQNGSRPSINYDAPDRKSRYAAVVKAAEDELANSAIEIAQVLKDKALGGNLGAIREVLNRVLGVPVQPMEVQSTSVQIEVTEERRELILRLEEQLIQETHGRRVVDSVARDMGATEELAPGSPQERVDPL